jgi:hypothetical protein
VTREGGTVQMSTSRAPQPVQVAPSGPLAPVEPPSVSSSVSYSRGLSRQQVGSLIKVAADSLPPEQMGCLVEAATAGVESGALPRDLRSLTPAQMQWLAQRCQLSMAQLAPVAAEFLSGSATAAFADAIPAATVERAPAPSVEQKLEAMKAANAPKPSSGVTWPVVGLLGLSLGGSLAAGVGLGQIIGRASAKAPRPKLKYATAPAAAAPAYRYSVSRPAGGRLVGAPLSVQLGKRYLAKPARG